MLMTCSNRHEVQRIALLDQMEVAEIMTFFVHFFNRSFEAMTCFAARDSSSLCGPYTSCD